MRKRFLVLCLAAAISLSAVGFGFAKWSASVGATVNPNTGSLKIGWISGSHFVMDSDAFGDFHALQGLTGVFRDPEGKEVASTTTGFVDTNGDGVLDRFNVTVNNAYPFYYNEISGQITNTGTIPAIIQKPKLYWMSTEKVIEDGFVYWLGKDGQIIQPTAAQIATPLQVGDNWVLELCWMDNADRQLHPGVRFEESFDLQVLQAADQSTTYNFGISVEGIQWNEIR